MTHAPIIRCSLCSKIAWYLGGGKGYCGDHRSQAIEAAKRENERRGNGNGYVSFKGSGH